MMNRKPAGRALTLLSGTWRTEGQLVGVKPGPRSNLIAVDRYERIPGLNSLAHYVAGHLGRKSVASFEIWSYVPSRGKYLSTSIDASGVASAFEGRLRGREWRIVGETQRFSGRFSADGSTLSGTWEQKSRRRWTPWMTITLRKVGTT
jgi:hypothetical protein